MIGRSSLSSYILFVYRQLFCLWVLVMVSLCCIAQKSDLYLFDISEVSDQYELSHPRLLSDFNPGGYTNQPSFVDAYRLLITVGQAATPAATDLYELKLRTNTLTRLTRTIDREYSPSINPFNPTEMYCVVVEVEKDDNQRLWSYPTDLGGGGRAVVSNSGQVGYYCPLKDNWMAVFEVGSPNKLFIYHTETGERKFISSNIGRSLHRSSDGSLVFVHKISDSHWFLKRVSTADFIPEVIKKTIPEAEDFCLLNDDSILMGGGSKLYHLNVVGDKMWREVGDLTGLGLNKITRLAFNGLNMLAVVTDR